MPDLIVNQPRLKLINLSIFYLMAVEAIKSYIY